MINLTHIACLQIADIVCQLTTDIRFGALAYLPHER
jgi:hypothetical protein